MLRWPVEPMRAVGMAGLPALARHGAVAEPKWDGFRAVAWRSKDGVELQSRHGRSLTRYFPDICRILAANLPPDVIVDGELIIWDTSSARTSFADLQRRLHAGRRISQEAAAHPAHLVCFDLLQDARAKQLLDRPLSKRRHRLQQLLASAPPQLVICPQTNDEHEARSWFTDWTTTGIEGLVVKRLHDKYRPGHTGWKKIKHRHTVEMVIGGVTGSASRPVTLLLGQYDHDGRLRMLAQTHPLNTAQRHELADLLRPMPFQGNDTGHPWPSPLPANWSLNLTDRQPLPYVQVEPAVVAEVEVDVATGPGGRPRHLTRHLRTRTELLPEHLPLWGPGGPT